MITLIISEKEQKLISLIGPHKAIELRPEQNECIDAIEKSPLGSRVMAVMPTGLGKTATFTSLPRHGKKMLILSAGQEIVLNPLVYFNPDETRLGAEMGQFRAKRDFPDAEVISASVQSIVNRLDDYDTEEFGTIIVDEAHHSPAPTYRKVIEYFKPALHLVGFTATPKRTDGIRLDDIYSEIVYQKDLRWAIANGRLCDVFCRKVSINVDLRNVRRKENATGETDFVQAELNRAMAHCAPAIVDIYKQYAFGATVINVAGVKLAYEVADMIPGSVAVTGDMTMQEREKILSAFREGKIQCLISVNVLKEGVDLPNIQTIIMCRPTLSSLLYTQIIGRGLRKCSGKKFLNLIDIEGILGPNVNLCSAITLLGIDASSLPAAAKHSFEGVNLSEMDNIALKLSDKPSNWVLNAKSVDAWADTSGYDLHDVNWFRMPDGTLSLAIPKRGAAGNLVVSLPPPDAMGMTQLNYARMPVQVALDLTAEHLNRNHQMERSLWNRNIIAASWGQDPATENQKGYIRAKLSDLDVDINTLSKGEAHSIIRHINAKPSPFDSDLYVMPYRDPEDVKREPVINLVLPPMYEMYPEEKTVLKEYEDWLERSVMSVYRSEKENLDRVIARINKSRKVLYGQRFMSYQKKYRYICGLNGQNVSRHDMVEWLAKYADLYIPRIIAARIVEPNRYKTVRSAKPDMTKPPYNAIELTYPESADIISGKKKKTLPSAAKLIQNQAKERWAAAEQRKSEKKKPGAKPTAKRRKKKDA